MIRHRNILHVLFQMILLCCYISIMVLLYSVQIYSAAIDYKHGKQRLATSGISAIIKPLIHGDIFSITLLSHMLKNPNAGLAGDDISIESFHNKIEVFIPTTYKFHEGEILGYVDYALALSPKGYIIIAIIYVALSFLLYFRYNGGKKEVLACLYKYDKLLLSLAVVVSIYCIAQELSLITIKEGETYKWKSDSGDMQWYPSVLFWGTNGFNTPLNPYNEALKGNVLLSGSPNYGHLLYILMYPFAIFDFDKAKLLWGIFNELCIVIAFVYIYRIFKDKGYSVLYFALLLALFFLSKTHSWAIFRGQISLVMTLVAILAFYYRNNVFILSICLSILISKYSFGVPIAFGFFVAGYIRSCIIAGIITLLSVAIFAYRFDVSILDFILSPLRVVAMYAQHNKIDLYTMLRTKLANPYISTTIFLAFIALWTSIIFIRKPSKMLIISSSIYLSLCLFPHHLYDYVIALAPLYISIVQFANKEISKRDLYLAIAIYAIFMFINVYVAHAVICYIYCLYLVWHRDATLYAIHSDN